MNDKEKTDATEERTRARKQIIFNALKEDKRAKNLSATTLDSIVDTMDPFFQSVEDAYKVQSDVRDKKWQHAMKMNSIRKGKIDKVIKTFNGLRRNANP